MDGSNRMLVSLLEAISEDTGRKDRKASSMSFSADEANLVQAAIDHRR
jgi:hypothetical protein